jgi:opacity protein-like surface antigen
MAAIYSNGGNRWNILGFNFTKRDTLSSVYKISMSLPYVPGIQLGF